MIARNTQFSSIILAGGQGRRFNGLDKGLVQWQGKPLIAHVIASVAPQVEDIVISCNRNGQQYQSFGYQTCSDRIDGFQGPLAGIDTALALVKHDWVWVCPCDAALLPNNIVSYLYHAIDPTQTDLAYPQSDSRDHYLPMLMKSSLANSISTYLKTGQRSIKGWFRGINTVAVPINAEEMIISNFNSPEDLI